MKYFVLDTNVLIHNPSAMYSFSEHVVVIPIQVIEELDRLKSHSDKKGMHARTVLRQLDRHVHHGALEQGVKLKSGGTLFITVHNKWPKPPHLNESSVDNKILGVAYGLQQDGKTVFFISKDVNARIKSEALGIRSMDYEKQKVDYSALYKGWKDHTLPVELFNQLSHEHEIAIESIGCHPNECVKLNHEQNQSSSLLARYDEEKKALIQLSRQQEALNIRPINLEQRFAYELLMDDAIKLVSLVGPAGTGKTLLALACGLEKVIGSEPTYKKMLVARPIMPLGKDIGYLPGSKDDKLNFWMQPIFDNLNFLLTQKDSFSDIAVKRSKKDDKVDYLMDAGIVEIEAITYIRGRSIPNQFMIIDEAQNLTPHEVKTIISRAGKGTKIVLTGDPEQIDNPYLDSNTNGLTYVAERLKSYPITGHVVLSKSERSELASLAAEQL